MQRCSCRWLTWGGLVVAGLLGCSRAPVATEADRARPPEETPTQSVHLTLDEEQRDYLWQIEHHGNLLSQIGFKAIKNALVAGDAKALGALLAPEFRGEIYQAPREIAYANAGISVHRRQDAGQPAQAVSRDAFIEQLLSYRKGFAGKPQAGMNLMKLAPAQLGKLDSPLWQGSCVLRLWGQSTSGGPAEVVLNLEYQLPKPTEQLFQRPAWLHSARIVQSLAGHSKQFFFREVARERGIDPSPLHDNWNEPMPNRKPNSGGVYLCDFDRDGILDLLITDVNGYFLYRGLPNGKFENVTEKVGLPRRPGEVLPNSILAGFADLDGDGWEDLILGNRVYRNEGGKRFVDVTFRTSLKLPLDAGGIAFADYDRDGKVDVYVTRPGKGKTDSWLEGRSGDTKGNQLWRNLGNWRFEDVTAASGTDGGRRSTFSAVWLDANKDGWPDLFVINEFGNGVLLLNRGNGTFQPQQLTDGPSDFGTMGVTAGDIDNDGNIDLYLANMYSKAGSRVIGNLPDGIYPQPIVDKLRTFVAGSQLYRNRGTRNEAGAGKEGASAQDASQGPKAPSQVALPAFERIGQRCQVAAVGWAYGAALVDLDNDGFLDLYATAGFMSKDRNEPDG